MLGPLAPGVLPIQGWLRPQAIDCSLGMSPVGPEQPGQTTTAPVSQSYVLEPTAEEEQSRTKARPHPIRGRWQAG